MAQVIPSSAVPVARQWTAAAAWSARVREVRADPLRRYSLLTVLVVVMACLYWDAMIAPVSAGLTGVAALVVIYLIRAGIGTLGAWRRTAACIEWAERQWTLTHRTLSRQSLRAADRLLLLLAAHELALVTLRVARTAATTRLRRGALTLTLLPRLDSCSLSLARG
jgi:hypothetical protein